MAPKQLIRESFQTSLYVKFTTSFLSLIFIDIELRNKIADLSDDVTVN